MENNNDTYQWLFFTITGCVVGILAFGGVFMSHAVYTLVEAVQNPLTLIADPTPPAEHQDESGCTHVLLLGGGGKEYDDGSELVDSIMVASLCSQPDQLVFTSIPRDLLVPTERFGQRKINTLYILAKHQLGEEHAFDLMLEGAQKVTGFPIHYYAYVDFKGFVKIFDSLAGKNGLSINVDPGFVDHEFPGPNYSYVTVRFENGPQAMDGQKALQFVRSRHGVSLNTGVAVATDFDRSRRQQEVLSALKDRVKDVLLRADMTPLIDTIDALQSSYQTNIPFQDMLSLANLWKKIDQAHTYSVMLKEGPGELLYVPSADIRARLYNGSWLLLPDGDDFRLIQKHLARVLKNPTSTLQGTTSVEVLNGTSTSGLAGQIANKIMHEGITVLSQYGVRNTYKKKLYPETLIIDRTGTNGELVKDIQKAIGLGTIVTTTTEPNLYPSVGITVIVGTDALGKQEGPINNSNIDIENYLNSIKSSRHE